MAKARALDRRRKSIRNIRKITRTMELISTATFRRAMDRALSAGAYAERLAELVGNLSRSGLAPRHPLLEQRPEPRGAALLVLSSNRGLCGGYNGGVLRLAALRWKELRSEFENLRLEVAGKRGVAGLRFRGIDPDRTFTHFEDRPRLDEVEVLAKGYLEAFGAGGLDRLEIVYTKFESLSRQSAVSETLLPIGGADRGEGEEEELAGESGYEFLPSAESILAEIVPMSFRVRLFKCFLDAAVSEQVARMLAMKATTENADQIIAHLTMTYNRARQGQITNELLEVISGAEAQNK
jgi:F-type H+-transporting ATPase subunit gamma